LTDLVGPVLLADEHEVEGFESGDDALDTWLRERARRNQEEGSSRTWVVTHDGSIVAFYASSTAVVLRANATSRARRNQPDPLPALLLGRLAVDRRWQGMGLGAALLKHFLLKCLEVAQITGVRVILVHARNPQVTTFYERYGFEASPIDDLTLMLLVKDIGASEP
jgi:GNAT superfamily N-acetyltransferase